jgi:hypothetical protein
MPAHSMLPVHSGCAGVQQATGITSEALVNIAVYHRQITGTTVIALHGIIQYTCMTLLTGNYQETHRPTYIQPILALSSYLP